MSQLEDVWLGSMRVGGLDPALALAVARATYPHVSDLFNGTLAPDGMFALVRPPEHAADADDPTDMAWITWPVVEAHWLAAVRAVETAWDVARARHGFSGKGSGIAVPRSMLFPHGIWVPSEAALQMSPPTRLSQIAWQATDPALDAESLLMLWLYYGPVEEGWRVVDMYKTASGTPIAMHAVEAGEIDHLFGKRLHPLPAGPFGILWLKDARKPPTHDHMEAMKSLWHQRLRVLALALPKCVTVAALAADTSCDPSSWRNRVLSPLRRLGGFLRRR